MIAIGSRKLSETTSRFINVEGTNFVRNEWMVSQQGGPLSPSMHLAVQPPDYSLLAHYHRQNQFQLFVDGEGSIGRSEIRPWLVHYAGAYTGYGPILSGPRGLTYFTMRATFDSGYTPIERAKAEMPRGPKKNAHSRLCEPLLLGELAALAAPNYEELIKDAGDGVASMLIQLPPSGVCEITHPELSVGQFLMVLNGTLHHGEQTLGLWESLFLSKGETPRLVAGVGGAELVAMCMPPRSSEYQQ